jgi:hypothetical protein
VRPGQDVGVRVRLGLGRVARLGLHDDRVLQEGGAGRDGGELVRELAEGKVQRAAAHQAAGGGVPERGRPAVAERDLVVLGEREQLAQAGADAADDGLHGRLAVRGAHDGGPLAGEVRQLLGPDLRRTAAEASVGGLELRRDLERRGRGVHGRGLRGRWTAGAQACGGCTRRSPVVDST